MGVKFDKHWNEMTIEDVYAVLKERFPNDPGVELKDWERVSI